MEQNNKPSTIINVEQYVYEKVKKSNVAINIPQEPIYFAEYNHRVIIGLFPQFQTWSDNSVWEIKIIEITDDSVEKTIIRTDKNNLSDMISRFDLKNKTNEEHLQDKVVRYLIDFYNDNRVSKEVFTGKYKSFLEKINDIVND